MYAAPSPSSAGHLPLRAPLPRELLLKYASLALLPLLLLLLPKPPRPPLVPKLPLKLSETVLLKLPKDERPPPAAAAAAAALAFSSSHRAMHACSVTSISAKLGRPAASAAQQRAMSDDSDGGHRLGSGGRRPLAATALATWSMVSSNVS